MNERSEVFETHYQDYCQRIAECDLGAAAGILGAETYGSGIRIRFLTETYEVSAEGIRDSGGERPAYGICVILAQYVLRCPDRIHSDPSWVAFKDFKKDAAVTNVNFFASDVEQALIRRFAGNTEELSVACDALGGKGHDTGASWDLSMAVPVLPRIEMLVLFNDSDEDFPAQCRVLFQGHAEFYLDPESLAMIGAGLSRALIRAAG